MSILNEMLDYNDEELNEARPYSRSQSAVDSAKGKVKGFFGSGHRTRCTRSWCRSKPSLG
ncbi:UNVERIFIED_ORG: hypothetical protein [Escherichia phage CMSTMSU]